MPPDPLVLAFDTSAAHCAVALVLGPDILAQQYEALHKGQAERLFPLLKEVLNTANKSWADLSAIGVGTGPGNFTGIRISVSAARGLALSLNIPAVGVSTFEAQAVGLTRPVLACVDARRNQTYVQLLNEPEPPLTDTIEDTIPDRLLPEGVSLVGAMPAIAGNAGANIVTAKYPLAVAIARIAAARYIGNPSRPAPLYIRMADAAPSSEPPPVILP